jgi:hypothetical protein
VPSHNSFSIIQLGICPGSNLLYAVEVLVTEVSEIFEAKLIQARSIYILLLFIWCCEHAVNKSNMIILTLQFILHFRSL